MCFIYKNSAVNILNESDGFGLFNTDSGKELWMNSVNWKSIKWCFVLK